MMALARIFPGLLERLLKASQKPDKLPGTR